MGIFNQSEILTYPLKDTIALSATPLLCPVPSIAEKPPITACENPFSFVIYDYDEVGNNTVVRDALGNETAYEYDKVNRRVAMVDALSQRTEYVYDDYDRLVRTDYHDGTYSSIEYDLAGRKTAEVDQEGKRTEFTYDSTGNLRTVKDAMYFVTEYTYDSNNNRVTQTDANTHTTTMDYNKLNRLTAREYHNGDRETFDYDANGNMVSKVDGEGDSTVFTYDSRNREVLRRFTNSGHTVRTVYTVDSKRDSVIDHRGITTYLWGDCCGQLVRVDNPDGTYLQYEYDDNKNKTAMITPWSRTEYRYDPLNRMDSVIADNGDVTRYFYNAVGNRDSIAHANGTGVKYRYDNLNRLTGVTNSALDGSVLSSYTYELNSAGIRTAVTEADGSRVDYGYDDLYRLTAETRTGTEPYSIAYTYDNVGNRITQTRDGVTTNYVYNNRDQLTSEDSAGVITLYTYDQAGRMTTKDVAGVVTDYGWEDDDRMVSVEGPDVAVSYVYDHNGQRVREATAADTVNYLVDYLLPYGQVVAETDGEGNPVATYVYGLDRISIKRGGNTYTYVVDGQGSVRQLTSAAGSVTDNYSYFAFGEELSSSGSTVNEFRYVGEQFDPNAEQYYLRARWYNPASGGFTSVDPYVGDKLSPVSLHRYLYGNNSPLTYIDPTGQSITMMDVMVTFAIIGALAKSVHYNMTVSEEEYDFGEQLEETVEGAFWGAFAGMNVYYAASILSLYTSRFFEYYRFTLARDIGRMPDLSKVRGVRPVASMNTEEESAWIKAFEEAASRKVYFRIRSSIVPENMYDAEGALTGFGKEMSTAGYQIEKQGDFWYFTPSN